MMLRVWSLQVMWCAALMTLMVKVVWVMHWVIGSLMVPMARLL